MKTKKQKREEILAKFEVELAELVAKRESMQLSYGYILPISARQLYIESQISALKRALGILPLQLMRKQNEN
jgi:hypothetical protein